MAEINLQEYGEFKNRVKSLEHRVQDIEDLTKAIYTQNVLIERLVGQIEKTNLAIQTHEKDIKDHEQRIAEIEKKDAKTLNHFKLAFIGAIAASVAGIVMNLVMAFMQQKGGI